MLHIDDWFYGYCGPLAVTPRRTLYLLSLKLKGVATRKSWLISPVLKGVATRKSRLIPSAMPKSFLIPLKNIIPELLFMVPCFPKTNPSCWACSEVGIWWFRSLDTAAVGLSGESATRLKGTEGHIVWRNSCPISGTLGFLSSSFSKISGQTIPRVTSTSLMNIPRRIMSSQMRIWRVAQNILSSSWGGRWWFGCFGDAFAWSICPWIFLPLSEQPARFGKFDIAQGHWTCPLNQHFYGAVATYMIDLLGDSYYIIMRPPQHHWFPHNNIIGFPITTNRFWESNWYPF